MYRNLISSLPLIVAACSAPLNTPADAVSAPPNAGNLMPESPPEPTHKERQLEQPAYRKTAEGVTGLPSGNDRTFATLDEYLAHLEIGGHTDRPYWEKLEDGRYRWNTGRGMQFHEPKYASREELLKKYGFDE